MKVDELLDSLAEGIEALKQMARWDVRYPYETKEQPMERKVFTYKDVEEARKWVGKRGVFTSDFKAANEGFGHRSILDKIEGSYPFVPEEYCNGSNFQFFSPDPVPVEKWVPFTAEDGPALLGKTVIQKSTGFGFVIDHFRHGTHVGLSWGDGIISTEYLLDEFTFMDGTPCGKKVVG